MRKGANKRRKASVCISVENVYTDVLLMYSCSLIMESDLKKYNS